MARKEKSLRNQERALIVGGLRPIRPLRLKNKDKKGKKNKNRCPACTVKDGSNEPDLESYIVNCDDC